MLIEARIASARVAWTDRHGGVSTPPYDTANLSAASADDAASVAENRRRLATRLELVDPARWWWLRQVHGNDVVHAHGDPPSIPPTADAALTTDVGVPLVVLTADCAPIVLATDGAVAVVHSGWQGLLAGVVERAVQALRDVASSPRVIAWVGPCIHPARYEFGRADLDRLVAELGTAVEGVTDWGTPALDLPGGVRAALVRAGVDDVHDVDVCTAASTDHFSHRRDAETGRQALVAVLDG
ncbi:MAG TPA: polyphenol oxidase family protein [Acidimicrobiia bacterium]|nr:polyphenol oxidase family protein [Acidimicrobiia bacterium]